MNGGSHLAGGNHPKLGGSYMTCPSCLLESPCRLQTCYKLPRVFSKIPCFCHQLPPTASFPGLIIAITVHLWHLLCRIVSRSPGTSEWRKITLRLHVFHTSFLLCIDIYIYNAYANTYIYTYIYIRTQMNKSISRCHP